MKVILYLSRVFAFVCIISASVFSFSAFASKYASFVMEADTGKVLYYKYATDSRHPASLTKMMTIYLVFEAIDQGRTTWVTPMRASARAARQPSLKVGIAQGESIMIKDAVLALITTSANDVATVIAEHMSGTEWQFARLMTKKAHSLGMKNTSFRNASGLYNKDQKTTASDMARLGLALQRDYPQYYKLFNTKKFSFNGREYSNHNALLQSFEGTHGIKTGYIRAAGFNLVASVTRDKKTLIGVVLGAKTSKSRNKHMQDILTDAFSKADPALTVHDVPIPSPRLMVSKVNL